MALLLVTGFFYRSVVIIMHLAGIAIAALAAVSEAAPTVTHRIQPRQNVTTASERLGLQWLGGNSSLPKIL